VSSHADDINKIYTVLEMPYAAVDWDNTVIHLVRILEELGRRDKVHREIAEKNIEQFDNLQKQIKCLQDLVDPVANR